MSISVTQTVGSLYISGPIYASNVGDEKTAIVVRATSGSIWLDGTNAQIYAGNANVTPPSGYITAYVQTTNGANPASQIKTYDQGPNQGYVLVVGSDVPDYWIITSTNDVLLGPVANIDIIVASSVTVGGGITLRADWDENGSGGVWITPGGSLTSTTGSIGLVGSYLVTNMYDVYVVPTGHAHSVLVQGAVTAYSDVTIQSRSVAPTGDVVISRPVESEHGDVFISA